MGRWSIAAGDPMRLRALGRNWETVRTLWVVIESTAVAAGEGLLVLYDRGGDVSKGTHSLRAKVAQVDVHQVHVHLKLCHVLPRDCEGVLVHVEPANMPGSEDGSTDGEHA